jgi:thiol:disulfide interchange protein DsbC
MKLPAIILALTCVVPWSLQAVAAGKVQDPQVAVVLKALEPMVVGVKASDIRHVPAAGLYEVTVGQGTAYVTPDGKYLLRGDLIEIDSRRNLTVARHDELRREMLDRLPAADAIVFGPKNAAHVVTVFTDVDCAFCRKLHREIATYADKGIAIRYFAYPAAGADSESWEKAEAVWCSANRKDALTRAKQGEKIPRSAGCETAPVAKSYIAAGRFGIEGTPLLVLENGAVISGYKSAAELLAIIEAQAPQARP